MINNTVEFEQRLLFFRVDPRTEAVEAHAWFDQCCKRPSHPLGSDGSEMLLHAPEDDQYSLARGIVDYVTGTTHFLPITFAFDEDRLAELRRDFQLHFRQMLVLEAVSTLLKRLWGRRPPAESEVTQITTRIQQLHTFDEEPPEPLAIALEVFQAVQRLHYGRTRLIPRDHVIECILERFEWGMDEYLTLHARARQSLLDSVTREIRCIISEFPLDIHRRYTPAWSARGKPLAMSVENMAQRIAHVSVIHWRVWGPTLYQPPIEQFQALRAMAPLTVFILMTMQQLWGCALSSPSAVAGRVHSASGE